MADTFKEVIQVGIETLGADDAAKLSAALKGIGDVGGVVDAKLGPLIDQFQELGDTSSKVADAIDISKKLAANSEALAQAKQALADLNAEFSRTDKSNADLVVAFQQSEKQVKSLAAEQLKLQNASASSTAALKAAGVDTSNLATANDQLKAKAAGVAQQITQTATAARNAGAGLKDSAEGAKSLGDESKKSGDIIESLKEHLLEIVSAAAAVELALKGIEFGKERFAEAADLEESLSRVRALAQGAQQDIARYETAVEQAGEEAGVSANQAAAGMLALVQAGRSADDAISALVPTLRLAKIAQVDVGQAAQIVDSTLRQFGLGAESAADVVDVLVTASHGAKDGLTGLGDSITKVAPLARDLNLSFKDTVSIFGLLTRSGLDAGDATKGLSTILAQLKDPASELRQALIGLGDTGSNFGKAIDVLSNSGQRGREVLDSLDASTRKVLLTLIQQGPQALAQFRTGLDSVTGAAQQTDKILNENLKGSFDDFTITINKVGSLLSKPILAPLRQELVTLNEKLESFSHSQSFQQLAQAIGDLASSGIAAVDRFIQGVDWQKFADGARTAISDAASSVKSFSDDLGAVAAALNTVGNVVGVVYRSIAVVFDLAKTTISGVVAAKFTELAALSDGIDAVTGRTSKLTQALVSVRDAAKDEAGAGIDALRANSEKLVDNLSTLAGASDGATKHLSDLGNKAVEAANKVQSVEPAFNAVTGAAANAGSALGLVPDYLDPIADKAGAASDGVKTLGTSLDATSAKAAAIQGEITQTAFKLGELVDAGQGGSEAASDLRDKLIALDIQLLGLNTKPAVAATGDLEAAFIKLHVQSQKSLDEAAGDAKKAFDTIDQGSAQTAKGLADRQAAFIAYANAALKAAANIDQAHVDSTQIELDSKASALGLSQALDKVKKSGTDAGQSTSNAFKNVPTDIHRVTDSLDKFSQSSDDAASSVGGVADSADHSADHVGQFSDTASRAIAAMGKDVGDSLDGIKVDLSQFSDAAREQFAAGQDAALQFGIHSQADLAAYVEAVNRAYNATVTQINAQKAAAQSFISTYSNLTDVELAAMNRQSGGAAELAAELQNVAQNARDGAGQFSLLNKSDLSQLEQSAEAAAQRVQAIADKAAAAKAALQDMADSIQDQIDQAEGNQGDAEQRRFQKQLQQIKDQADASGLANSQEYDDAVQKAQQLHDINMRNIDAEDAAKKKSADDAAASISNANSASNASSGSSGAGTGDGGFALKSSQPQKLDITFNGTNLPGVDPNNTAQLNALAAKLLPLLIQQIKAAARSTGLFPR